MPINPDAKLVDNIFETDKIKQQPTRNKWVGCVN